jgi:hypothetical protein
MVDATNLTISYVVSQMTVIAGLLGKGVPSGKFGIGVWYRAQGTLVERILAEKRPEG